MCVAPAFDSESDGAAPNKRLGGAPPFGKIGFESLSLAVRDMIRSESSASACCRILFMKADWRTGVALSASYCCCSSAMILSWAEEVGDNSLLCELITLIDVLLYCCSLAVSAVLMTNFGALYWWRISV